MMRMDYVHHHRHLGTIGNMALTGFAGGGDINGSAANAEP